MDWHEQSGRLQLYSFIREDKASWFYRFLVIHTFRLTLGDLGGILFPALFTQIIVHFGFIRWEYYP